MIVTRGARLLTLALLLPLAWEMGWSLVHLDPPAWTYYLFALVMYVWFRPWLEDKERQ